VFILRWDGAEAMDAQQRVAAFLDDTERASSGE
jgi:hypothetical protein